MNIDLARLANDRYEIADALHRYAFGLDFGDADSLASALTEDCVLDSRPAGKKLNRDFPLITGRQAILDSLLPLLGPLDSSHTATNLQIEINDDSATLSAYLMAQYFMPRQGSKRGAENALLMNRYDCELVRVDQKWHFKRITVDNMWSQGNPEILHVLATHRVLTSKAKKG